MMGCEGALQLSCVNELVAAAALHSHSLENCGNAQLSQWISVAFLSIRRLCIVSFSAKFLGVQDFSHTFSVASVVIITRVVAASVVCGGVPLVRVRRSREGTAFTK
jgi:hypothetical protein